MLRQLLGRQVCFILYWPSYYLSFFLRRYFLPLPVFLSPCFSINIFNFFIMVFSCFENCIFILGWEELILAFKKNLGDMNSHPVSFSKISEALMKSLKEYGKLDEESLRNFDDHVLSNLKELHRLYWDHHKKLIPYAKAYLDLFGNYFFY